MKKLLLPILFLSNACASFQVRPELLKQVKTVAIINLETTNHMGEGGTGGGANRRNNGVSSTINSVRAINSEMNGTADLRQTAELTALYDALAEKLKQTGLTPASRESIAQNPKFQQLYARIPQYTVFGMPKKPATTFATNELRYDLRPLAARQELMDALQVDAVVSVEVTFQTGKTGGVTIGGFGALKRYPQAVVTIHMYDRTNLDPIWVDYRVVGATASEGLQETMGVADTRDPVPLFVETASSAFESVVARFEQAKSAPPTVQ